MDDIEDITTNNTINDFLKDFVLDTIHSEEDFQKKYRVLRSKYKICPSKPTLRRVYHDLLNRKEISKNQSFLNFSLKRKCRSSSGVNVITILTSPFPKYTNSEGKQIIQQFSCGKNCAYCPNEPEIKITMKITNVNTDLKSITISTEDDIHLIRVLTYVVQGENHFDVERCYHFNGNSFIIELSKEIDHNFEIGDTIIGVKIAQPRSYLSTEPAVLRANRNNFDATLQIYDRADALQSCGHEVDKIEVLVLGGTWDHYPLDYQREFIRDIYYSINTLTNRFSEKLSLQEEIKYNQTSVKRMIGLTLETRPDCVTLKQIKRLREFNVTRLQIGVQHIDNDVLLKIDRGCTNEDTIKANHLWKHNGGKIDWHLMPDLPGSSIEKDIEMFRKIFSVKSITEISKNHFVYDLTYPEFQADQLKIYPCSVVDWTKIKEWYEDGSYKPYSENEEDLIRVIVFIKQNIFPWIRLNRIIRDIPNLNLIGGNQNVNLRQKILARGDVNCQCIRCREVKDRNKNLNQAKLFVREYNGTQSTEYFISFESSDQQILYGFVRLRINHSNDQLIYNELIGCSLIRELHVYGSVVRHDKKKENNIQHLGFGKKLIQAAERLSFENGIHKIAIISGVGVREYYEGLGYHLVHNYMIKNIKKQTFIFEITICTTIAIILISIFYDLYYINVS